MGSVFIRVGVLTAFFYLLMPLFTDLAFAQTRTFENFEAKPPNYIRKDSGVDPLSVSWSGYKLLDEQDLDGHSDLNLVQSFFASSGDYGLGVEWPAVSGSVFGVGGITPHFSGNSLTSETAWLGLSQGNSYISIPDRLF